MRDYFSAEAVSILKLLLEKNPDHRLGGYKHSDNSPSSPPSSQMDDAQEIRDHPFFASIDWNQIKKKTHKAPFIPYVKSDMDTSLIDQMFTKEKLEETYVDISNKSYLKNAHFNNFTYEKKNSILYKDDFD